MTSSSNVVGDVRQGLRLRKVNTRYFSFKWKSETGESTSSKNNDNSHTTENLKEGKKTNGFFRNIRNKLSIKKMYKSKRRMTAVDSSREIDKDSGAFSENLASCIAERNGTEIKDRIGAAIETTETIDSSEDQKQQTDKYLGLRPGQANDGGATSAGPTVKTTTNSENDQNPTSDRVGQRLSNLTHELGKFGWYWGPISRDEADTKLIDQPDGAFLIRDSSDYRYLLALSFKSAGKVLHSRIEHSDGKFSLCNRGNYGVSPSMLSNGAFLSIPDLVQNSMGFSKNGVCCYSRSRHPGIPDFPVRLTNPVSRLTQVRSLQYLCRFVIRENIRLDNIHKLPLPNKIKGYLEEAHY